MIEKKENNIGLICGIFFAVWVLLSIVQSGFSFYIVLRIIAVGAICFALFTKRRDIVLCAGLAGLAITSLFSMIRFWVIILSLADIPMAMRFCVPELFVVLGYIAATLIAVVELTNFIPQLKGLGKKIWFVPAILCALSISTLFNYFDFLTFVLIILEAAAVLLTMMWVVSQEELLDTAMEAARSIAGEKKASVPVTDEIHCDLVKHILLLLLTFGIWFLIWIYRVTGYTNIVKDEEERNPTTKLLLCMFVPFYQIYWTYITAQRVDKMAAEKGLQTDLSTLCLILAIFVPIIPPILIQDKLNNIAAGTAEVVSPQNTKTVDSETHDTVEELKKYKELLDSGIITQEEFDAKKKQLLGL